LQGAYSWQYRVCKVLQGAYSWQYRVCKALKRVYFCQNGVCKFAHVWQTDSNIQLYHLLSPF
jgi:hypothetical protein